MPDRNVFFDTISTAIPAGWTPGSVDAVATASADGRRLVIKAVNYQAERNSLLVRLKGALALEKATATLYTITAGLMETAALDRPGAISTLSRPLEYARDFTVVLDPYSVAVVEIKAS